MPYAVYKRLFQSLKPWFLCLILLYLVISFLIFHNISKTDLMWFEVIPWKVLLFDLLSIFNTYKNGIAWKSCKLNHCIYHKLYQCLSLQVNTFWVLPFITILKDWNFWIRSQCVWYYDLLLNILCRQFLYSFTAT